MRVRTTVLHECDCIVIVANNIILRRNNQTRVHARADRKKPTRRDLVPINMRKEEFSIASMCVCVLLKIFSVSRACVVSERWMLAGCIVLSLCVEQRRVRRGKIKKQA